MDFKIYILITLFYWCIVIRMTGNAPLFRFMRETLRVGTGSKDLVLEETPGTHQKSATAIRSTRVCKLLLVCLCLFLFISVLTTSCCSRVISPRPSPTLFVLCWGLCCRCFANIFCIIVTALY